MQHMAEDLVEHRYHGLGPNQREAPFAKLFRVTLCEKFEKRGSKAMIVERIEVREPCCLGEGIESITHMRVPISSIGWGSQIGIRIMRRSKSGNGQVESRYRPLQRECGGMFGIPFVR